MPVKKGRARGASPQPSGRPLLLILVAVAAVGTLIYLLREPDGSQQAVSTAAAPAAAVPAAPTRSSEPPLPTAILIAPDLPPLPLASAPSGPLPVVRAAYEFAARHPEVLKYIPCFCGCEQEGHGANDDCFVAARSPDGRIVWDPHGMT